MSILYKCVVPTGGYTLIEVKENLINTLIVIVTDFKILILRQLNNDELLNLKFIGRLAFSANS